MKKYLVLIIAGIFMWGSTYAQPYIDVVHKALDGSNAQTMVKYFDNVLAITINDEQSTYSKAQAEMVIKSFLAKNAVKAFTVVSAGSASREDLFFIIGEVRSATRGRYKVYLSFRQKGKVSTLQQIKFEQLRD